MSAALDADWRLRDRVSRRRRRLSWWGSIGLAVVTAALLAAALHTGQPLRGALATLATLTGVGAAVWGGIIHLRAIDEQEREAVLWGSHVGLTVYALLTSLATVMRAFHLAFPLPDYGIFFATMGPALAVTAWKRFR